MDGHIEVYYTGDDTFVVMLVSNYRMQYHAEGHGIRQYFIWNNLRSVIETWENGE